MLLTTADMIYILQLNLQCVFIKYHQATVLAKDCTIIDVLLCLLLLDF